MSIECVAKWAESDIPVNLLPFKVQYMSIKRCQRGVLMDLKSKKECVDNKPSRS